MEQNQEKPLELEDKFKTAAELGISEEQRCGLIKTLAHIEAGKTSHINYYNNPELLTTAPQGGTYRFNMMVWKTYFPCGTVCCLGGTAEMLGNVGYPKDKLPRELRHLFGLNNLEYKTMNEVTERQAGVALRGYLTTGKTDWATARKSPR
jgi:hypothetical protein